MNMNEAPTRGTLVCPKCGLSQRVFLGVSHKCANCGEKLSGSGGEKDGRKKG